MFKYSTVHMTDLIFPLLFFLVVKSFQSRLSGAGTDVVNVVNSQG